MQSNLTHAEYAALQKRAMQIGCRLSTSDNGATFQLARTISDGPGMSFFELGSVEVVLAAIEESPAAVHFPRTERRELLAEIFREHYGPEVEIVDAPLDWMPGAGHSIDALGITESEFVATARLIAQVTDCTIGDASGHLDLIATVLEVTR